MKNYEVFQQTTPDNLAVLLTSMVAAVADVQDPLEIREIYEVYKELLMAETELGFLVDLSVSWHYPEEADDSEPFAQRLKTARKAAGLSQTGMADRTTIPLRVIESWEQADRTPAPYVQHLVLRELGRLAKK